jgi:transcriptional regulator with PAS, ATPase and Fis domain
MRLPPLCDRREYIPLLVDHFIVNFNRLQHKHVVGVSEQTMAILLEHDYPGNVRELENIVEHAFVLCREGLIQPCHLPAALRRSAPQEIPPGDGALSLQSLEKMHIIEAIRRHGGNRKAAARGLGIHPSTLFRKVKAFGIPLPEKDGRSRGCST